MSQTQALNRICTVIYLHKTMIDVSGVLAALYELQADVPHPG
jgi:hypothetical protein